VNKNFPPDINPNKIPQHVAVIMDGNGRWAKNRGFMRIFGHQSGVGAVRQTSEAAAELGVKYLTLYTFSTENWSRPESEVRALMKLIVDTIDTEMPDLMKNNIKLAAIGNMDDLPVNTQKKLKQAIRQTAGNSRLTMILALSYSSRWEIIRATKLIADKVKRGLLDVNDINEEIFKKELSTAGIPDPELLIRTSGEQRISNYLLWQIAYSELYFTPKLWPDFTKQDFYDAVAEYQRRERRFGKTHEQIVNEINLK
jgi:undecaprenyl diphosphate synthase